MGKAGLTEIEMNGRILVCFGQGSEIVKLTNYCPDNTKNIYWWAKSNIAVKALTDNAVNWPSYSRFYIENSVVRIKNDLFSKKIKEIVDHHLEGPLQIEWVQNVLAYEIAKRRISFEKLPNHILYSGVAHLYEALQVIDFVKPNVVLIRAGTRIEERAFKIIADAFSIPYLLTERGAFPNSLFLDDINVGSGLLRTVNIPGEIRESENRCINNFIELYKNSQNSAWEQPPLLGKEKIKQKYDIKDGQKIIFYVAQVEDDANMVLESPLFSTNASFLEYIIRAASQVSNTVIVVKPHPKELKNIDTIREKHGVRLIIDREINIKDAFLIADVVATINSTVGFEALIYKKPVIVGGNAHYSHRGLTLDITQSTDISVVTTFIQDPISMVINFGDASNYVQDVISQSSYFFEPLDGLNGPEDFWTRIYSKSSPYRQGCIPDKFLLNAHNFMGTIANLESVSSKSFFEIGEILSQKFKSRFLRILRK